MKHTVLLLTASLSCGGRSLPQAEAVDSGDVPALADAKGPSTSKTVFVTSGWYAGYGLGGLSSADARCQSSADAAGLSGTFKAWLGGWDATGYLGPLERFSRSTLPYVRRDGALVAYDFASLLGRPLMNPISITETGHAVSGVGNDTNLVWTDVNADGTVPTDTPSYGGSCFNWNQGGYLSGRLGNARATDATWTENGTASCNSRAKLYCFEQ